MIKEEPCDAKKSRGFRHAFKSFVEKLTPELLWKVRRWNYMKSPRSFWSRVGQSKSYENPGSEVTQAQGKFIAERIRGLSPKSVLEVGCGWGRILGVMRQNLDSGTQVVGVDFGQPQLTLAHEQLGNTCGLIGGNAARLPFKDNSFDVVYTMGVFMHIPPEHIEAAYSEAIRVSRKYVVHGEDLSGSYHRFSYDHEKEYRKRGLAIRLCETPSLLHVDPKKIPQFLIAEKV